MKKGKGKRKDHLLESKEESESEDKRLRLCLLNRRNLSEKSGSSQLKGEVSIVSGE